MHIIRSSFRIMTLVLLCIHTNAQKDQWTVKAGESIQEVLGDSAIYKYPQFMQGIVYYKDGRASRGSLNFNFVTGEMQFIAPSKDTLAIANEATIKYITIQQDTFYFDKVYIQLIHGNALAKLGKFEIIKLGDIKKEAAFGQMSSTTAIEEYSTYLGRSQTYKLAEKTTITLKKKTEFFIADSSNDFLPATKKNINKMFGGKSPGIESFINQNKITTTNEADLLELINFLGKI